MLVFFRYHEIMLAFDSLVDLERECKLHVLNFCRKVKNCFLGQVLKNFLAEDLLSLGEPMQRRGRLLSSKQKELLQSLFCIGDFVFGGAILLTTVITVSASLDPFRIVFDDLLSHPYDRTFGIIVASWFVRIALGYLCLCEFF